MKELSGLLCDFAVELGFDLVGVTQAEKPSSYEYYEKWINAGKHAGMSFLAKHSKARSDLNFILPGVKSVLMLGVTVQKVVESDEKLHAVFFPNSSSNSTPAQTLMPTPAQTQTEAPARDTLTADAANHNLRENEDVVFVASYATGIDYHFWIRERLKKLSEKFRQLVPQGRCRGVVDTAPLLERQFAVNAGLGQIGKNTMLINPEFGSRIFLAALLSTEKLLQSAGSQADKNQRDTCAEISNVCESCNLCCDACPTGALTPYELDAKKCLNYWTIEYPAAKKTNLVDLHKELPEVIRKKIKQRKSSLIFGCEICQRVCPCNQKFDFTEGIVSVSRLETEFCDQLFCTPLGRVLEKTKQ